MLPDASIGLGDTTDSGNCIDEKQPVSSQLSKTIVDHNKTTATINPASQIIWTIEENNDKQQATCYGFAIMGKPSIISFLIVAALLSMALVLALQTDEDGAVKKVKIGFEDGGSSTLLTTANKTTFDDLTISDGNYRLRRYERLMRPSAERGEDSVEHTKWIASREVGGASWNRGDRDNPQMFQEEQMLQTNGSAIRPTRSRNTLNKTRISIRSEISPSTASATSNQNDFAFEMVDNTIVGEKKTEAINIDKIKGIEFSLNQFKEIGDASINDQISALKLPPPMKCNINRFDLKIVKKFDKQNLSRPIIRSDGRFDNPFPTWSQQSTIDLFKFVVMESDESNVPKSKQELDKELPLMKPDFVSENSEDFRATWIGHSTLLIQVDGVNILTDPIFSDRASPTQLFGPKRIREPAVEIKKLPRIHIVLISHNHYDHLDADSVKELNDRFGVTCRWIVPIGLGSFMQAMSIENFVELDWWQKECYKILSDRPKPMSREEIVFNRRTFLEDTERLGEIGIYLTPSQHWSRRGVNDFNKSLWGSYTIVNRRGSTFLFGGDTAYCEAFKEIGDIFGPFTGAAIPIGAYKPRWFLKASHIDPDEAIQIHKDIKSMKSISIHHSTFVLSNEYYKEPTRMLDSLMETLKHNNSDIDPFISLKHGETTLFFNELAMNQSFNID